MHCELITTETHEGFEIAFYACEEDMNPRDCFDPEIEAEFDTFGKIERGELVWFCAKVTASKNDIVLGEDYLGGCCYNSVQEFWAEKDGYAGDMIDNAIAHAKKKLAQLCA